MTQALYRACQQAVHVVTADGHVLRGGRAVLFVLSNLGFAPGLMEVLAHPPFVWLVEAVYRLAARYRGILGRLWR